MPNAEKRKELTRQTIIRVKEKIAAEDLTEAEVLQRMLDAGETTSATTVHRFLDEGSEDTAGFNYNLTVKPFARVFLELSQTPNNVELAATEAEKDRAALDNIIQLKALQIESLEVQLASERAETQKKIGHLIKQLEEQRAILAERKGFMDERKGFIYDLQAESRRKSKVIALESFIIAVLVLVIISALIIDGLNPDMGFFWLEDAAAAIFGIHGQTGSVAGAVGAMNL